MSKHKKGDIEAVSRSDFIKDFFLECEIRFYESFQNAKTTGDIMKAHSEAAALHTIIGFFNNRLQEEKADHEQSKQSE